MTNFKQVMPSHSNSKTIFSPHYLIILGIAVNKLCRENRRLSPTPTVNSQKWSIRISALHHSCEEAISTHATPPHPTYVPDMAKQNCCRGTLTLGKSVSPLCSRDDHCRSCLFHEPELIPESCCWVWHSHWGMVKGRANCTVALTYLAEQSATSLPES